MKKTKPLWRVSVITTLEAEDAVAEMLGSTFGVAAAAYYDLEKKVSLVSAFIEKTSARCLPPRPPAPRSLPG